MKHKNKSLFLLKVVMKWTLKVLLVYFLWLKI
nr:MAG TPA: hypothetical protein [Caudoviricetes sp.]